VDLGNNRNLRLFPVVQYVIKVLDREIDIRMGKQREATLLICLSIYLSANIYEVYILMEYLC
jgi:hypothetical protein